MAAMLLAIAALLLLGRAAAAQGLACGDAQGGWFIVPGGEGAALYHMPANAAPGSMVPVTPLAAAPQAMTSLGGRMVMVFDPVRTAAEAPAPVRQIRELSATPGSRAPLHFFSQLAPLPPLPGSGTLRGVALTREGLLAHLDDHGDAKRQSLLELRGLRWEEAEVPEALDMGRPWMLGALGGAAVIVQSNGSSADATIWIRDYTVAGRAGRWRAERSAPLPSSARLLEASGQLMALVVDEQSGRTLRLFRSGKWLPVAIVEESNNSQWVVPAGDSIAIVRSPADERFRFFCRAVSPSGEVIYDGPAQTTGPVSRRELELLGLLLASLVLTIAVFVFRPAGSDRAAVQFPDGWALAEPWRRILATFVDVLIAALISSLFWNVPFRGVLDLSAAVTGEHGIWPLVTAAAALAAIGTGAEAATGRTLGKWLLRCRVISVSGGNPTLGQAAARNLVKALCPPLAAASLGAPGQRSPTAFGTLVIAPVTDPRAGDSAGGAGDGKNGDQA